MRLEDPLFDHFKLTDSQKRALKKLGVFSIHDLLCHFPSRYEQVSDVRHITDVAKGENAIFYGTITKLQTRKSWKSRKPIAEGYIEDGTGRMKIMWFHQPYIAKMIPEGSQVKVVGKITGSTSKPYIANPEITPLETLPIHTDTTLFNKKKGVRDLFPIYPESKGITSKWMYHTLQKIFQTNIHETMVDPIPETIRKRYSLPSLRTALVWIHTPQKEQDAVAARKRFAFEEVFFIQLLKQTERAQNKARATLPVIVDEKAIKEFMETFPFETTRAQNRAIQDTINDFKRKYPMARLLEGDVGSGKTAVAATTAYSVVTSTPAGQDFGHLQVAYMAPTEILAKQQFESFIEFFTDHPIAIGLITGSGCRKFPSKIDRGASTDISRAQLLKWVANGEIPILIGTHALIQKTVQFQNLTYVIIDEQHRFGTVQRQQLVRKDNITPHLLSMTATPIPRTLALTVYGDLDLTLLDEMPKGRKPIMTEIVAPEKRRGTYEKVREELKAGRQVYVICPRINEPDPEKELALNAKSVKEEAKRLKKDVFPEYEIDILHSKLRPKEKEDVMRSFLANDTQILVATSVVEVGVNVPNATVIVIEGAERFGLAQLHQLRGRVLRSTHQAYCYVFTDTKSLLSLDRLRALKKAKSGFELAEHDLRLRGAGELYGTRQWGISDIGMEAIKNIKMVEAARNEAQVIVEDDPLLTSHKELAELMRQKTQKIHFE